MFWGVFFPKYFSLFSRLIYLKDHQGTNPHVRFMLYHLFFSHKQDFKQNRAIYTVLRRVNRCSRQGLDPKSTTDLLGAKGCTNYSCGHRGMIKFFYQKTSLGPGSALKHQIVGKIRIKLQSLEHVCMCFSQPFRTCTNKRYTKDMTDLYTIVMELSLEAPEFLTSSQVKQKAQPNAQPLHKSPPALGPAQPALGLAQPQCKAKERWSAKIHV